MAELPDDAEPGDTYQYGDGSVGTLCGIIRGKVVMFRAFDTFGDYERAVRHAEYSGVNEGVRQSPSTDEIERAVDNLNND